MHADTGTRVASTLAFELFVPLAVLSLPVGSIIPAGSLKGPGVVLVVPLQSVSLEILLALGVVRSVPSPVLLQLSGSVALVPLSIVLPLLAPEFCSTAPNVMPVCHGQPRAVSLPICTIVPLPQSECAAVLRL